MTRIHGLHVLIAVMALGVVAAGCEGGGDTTLYVHNASNQTWYLSVWRTQPVHSSLSVVRVDPGADGLALYWYGGRGVEVRVLAADCSMVGAFHRGDDGTYVVDAVPGLTGRIEDHGQGSASREEGDGVEYTGDCGGTFIV